jgi:hypothetical protein
VRRQIGLVTVAGAWYPALNHLRATYEWDNFNKLLGAGVSVATSGRSEQTQHMESSLWCWFTSRGDAFSRNHETEADQIGLTLMAIAGYNPEEAIFGLEWQQILPEKLHLSS